MSVIRKSYFFSNRKDSAISSESKSRIFLFHIPRSSIHFIPNPDTTSQARPKSWLISSLMTATRNGEVDKSAEGDLVELFSGLLCANRLLATVNPIVATNSRRETKSRIKFRRNSDG